MNELITKQFEESKVQIIINEEGNPEFELYSTGMALGQVKVAKGKSYPNRDRIDNNVKNAEISTVVRNAQQFLTEPMLYDLMLEMKTDKVKPFKKWITNEVLPSLRKNGTYSITPQNNNIELMVSNLVQQTVVAIIPTITTEMAKVVIASKEQLDRSQEQIDQSAELLHDQAVIYDKERQELKDLIGFKSANTSRMVSTIKEKLSDKLGIKVLANNPMFIKVKKEVFREFSVVKWEDIAVERYSAVYAFVDTYISEMK